MADRGQVGAESEKARIRDLYARLAGSYDWSLPLFRLAGFREGAYRRELVAGLDLSPGDTVVDLGCGTGRNFPDLREAVGAEGAIIGVDFSPAMLARARRRVEGRGWGNVTLVEAEAADFGYPANVRAVVVAFALGAMPDYERAITRATEALPPGGRLGMLELTYPERWPRWLADLGVRLMHPYGANFENARRRPWEAVPEALRPLSLRERYFGAIVLAVGERHSAEDYQC
ncbi:MAG: class I SAM-dependent methyltransferase [Thiohalorhabdaceae bacterium]